MSKKNTPKSGVDEPSSGQEAMRARAGTSPISRGGAGTEFENPVAAYYLAQALLYAVPRGQWTGTTQAVRFQQHFAGEPLDDLVVVSQVPTADRHIVLPRLALQMKRGISITETNSTFDEVLRACWETFTARNADGTSRFRFRFDRFGIVFNVYNATVDRDYRPLLEWARDSDSVEGFFGRVGEGGAANSAQTAFVQWMRRKLDDYNQAPVDDEAAWRSFTSLIFLHFDFGNEGSRDYATIIEALKRLLPSGEQAKAPDLWLKLNAYATRAKVGAGGFSTRDLCEALRADGFPLEFGKDCRDDLERLEQEADHALAEIGTTIGGLSLARPEVLQTAREALEESRFLLLSGSYGVGKSALWKRLLSLSREHGPALVISGDDLNRLHQSVTSWNTYASQIGVRNGLPDLLSALGGGLQPTIFLDGIDRVVSDGARRVVKDLLRIASTYGASPPDSEVATRRWKVVATARQENLRDVQAWLGDILDAWQPFQVFEVPRLTAEEVDEVIRRLPRLRPLQSVTALRELLRTPFLLSLLADPRIAGAPEVAQAQINTELDVCELWWKRVVGLTGGDEDLGEERRTLLLRMAVEAAKHPGAWIAHRLVAAAGAAEALNSLRRDAIVSPHPDADRLRLRRDPLEEWVVYRYLLAEHEIDLAAFLADSGQPIGLYRPVQLVGMHLLERDLNAQRWSVLLRSVEADAALQPRWREALLLAPMLSTRGVELLQAVEVALLENKAARLCDLLRAMRTVEVNPNVVLMKALSAQGVETHQVESLGLAHPIPRGAIWARLFEWLLPRVEAFAEEQGHPVRDEAARVMRVWQQATSGSPKFRFRREIAAIALKWLSEEEFTHSSDDYEPPDW